MWNIVCLIICCSVFLFCFIESQIISLPVETWSKFRNKLARDLPYQNHIKIICKVYSRWNLKKSCQLYRMNHKLVGSNIFPQMPKFEKYPWFGWNFELFVLKIHRYCNILKNKYMRRCIECVWVNFFRQNWA